MRRHIVHQLLEGVHRAVVAHLLGELIHRVRRSLGSGLFHGFLVHSHEQAVAAHLQQVALILGYADLDGLEAVLTVAQDDGGVNRGQTGGSAGAGDAVQLRLVRGGHQAGGGSGGLPAHSVQLLALADLLYIREPVQGIGVFLLQRVIDRLRTDLKDHIVGHVILLSEKFSAPYGSAYLLHFLPDVI